MGRGYRIQAWIKDISERKRQEQELLENRRLLNTILFASPVGIARVRDRKIVWSNRAFLEMFGFKDEQDCVGRTTGILYSSEAEYQRIGDLAYGQLQSTELAGGDVTLRRQDGTLFEGHVSVRSVDPSDPLRDTIAVYTDISDRERAEQESAESRRMLDHVLEASPWELRDSKTAALSGRTEALDMFGFADESECVGESAKRLYSSEDEFKLAVR